MAKLIVETHEDNLHNVLTKHGYIKRGNNEFGTYYVNSTHRANVNVSPEGTWEHRQGTASSPSGQGVHHLSLDEYLTKKYTKKNKNKV
jgi:hypothetical protein